MLETHLVIATPCYGGSVFQNYFLSVLQFASEAQRRNLTVSFIIQGGDSLIPRIRNAMVAEFMQGPGTHLLWIDADIGFKPEQIFRLLEADRDVVCGIYPFKRIDWPEAGVNQNMTKEIFEATYTQYPYNPLKDAVIDEDGFVEVYDAPTGMMMIKRAVFEKMAKAYPGLSYVPDRMIGIPVSGFNYRFFDVMTEESGRYLSEDYAFCRRWQNIGGKISADTKSNLSHQGAYLYTGNLSASLSNKT
jgi:hypothetical protein